MPLDPVLASALRQALAALLARETLLLRESIDRYYATFRERFGPDVLAGLRGQALLTKMHGRGETRDSLVYWLEFKNDEEFPTQRFGGIGGGSALKYGIYRRSDTGQWMTGSGTQQTTITEERAAEIASEQRDELIAGARLLDRWRAGALPLDYAALQRELEKTLPTLHHLGWVHKYFALLFPEILDDFHAVAYQRYYLIKLRLKPLGEGLYYNAGLFMTAARELGIHPYHLTGTLNRHFGPPRRVWKIGTGDDGVNEDQWAPMRDGGHVAIGWHELGDLRNHIDGDDLRADLQRLHDEAYPGAKQAVRSKAVNQVARFVRDISVGDLVLAVSGMTVLGIGEIQGNYEFLEHAEYPHSRRVRWLDLDPWELPVNKKPRQAVASIDDDDNLLAVELRIAAQASRSTPSVAPAPVAAEQLPPLLRQIADLLDHKPQLILHGPPGTGKSYWARRAARELAARSWFGRSLARLSAEEQQFLDGPEGALELCTFHPGYGYEDFVEGLRPLLDSGHLAFELRDGVFKLLCDRAAKRPDRLHFLFIDEINRGDLPRIFGELLTLLERDKRGWPLTLALSKQRFVVPPNLRIVATMNTADRSISLLDAALRRRFAFIELMPDPAALVDAMVLGLPLGPLLGWINERLSRCLGAGARQLQIGHAYFMVEGQPISDPHRLVMALRNDILPLLEEYCYEDRKHLRSILGRGLFRADSLEFDAALFEPRQRDRLASALRSHFAEELSHPDVVELIARAQARDEDA
ncbi:McrB family protein [Nannocystis radixulma]|uniref:AAA family ATPase n=1 Tax=Nannocystis radixulma TaxID=2995305 RepID=A0ABT5BJ43_9BACT|nr:AAA family ATPase [Nannocystis radixulma]MDC0672981.1 AAA family ATPase [Nannocystis radixulma]